MTDATTEPGESYRISPLQRHLWLLHQQNGAAADCCVAVRLEGDLDVQGLRRSLSRLVGRHGILRTRFEELEWQRVPVQTIAEAGNCAWEELDLSGLDHGDRQRQAERLLRAAGGPAAGAANGTVLRAHLLACSRGVHLLLLRLHALCGDPRSLWLLTEELAAGYSTAARLDEDPEVPQYLQFSEWQNELQTDEEARAGLEFWRARRYPGPPGRLLPFETAERGDGPFQPERVAVAPGAAFADHLAALGERYGRPPGDVLLACWGILLRRLAGEEEVTLSVLREGRRYAELRGILGLLARPLPLALRLHEDRTLAEVLAEAGRKLDEVDEWQEFFGLEAGPDGAPNPFDARIAFEFQDWTARWAAGGVTFSIDRQEAHLGQFRLKLLGVRLDRGLRLELHYDPRCFARPDVLRLAIRLEALLASCARSPEVPIGDLDILGESERHRLLIEGNDTRAAAEDGRVEHLLAPSLARTPERPAVLLGAGAASFAAVEARANQLARHLQDLGVGPDTLVAVWLERSPELLVALLGILKAGGAYLPLDPSYPLARRNFILQDAAPRLIVTTSSLISEPLYLQAKVVQLDGAGDLLAACPASAPESRAEAGHLAYVIYTSGSTGKPKGVMVTRGGLLNYLRWAAAAFGAEREGGAPLHSSVGFDLTVTSLFVPWLTGRAVAVVPEDEGLEGLAAALQEGGPWSFVKLTPAHLDILNDLIAVEAMAGRVGAVVIGGEALTAERVARWRRELPGTRLINEYGPTETVVGCCIYELPPAAELAGAVPIGRPIANTRLYLLDRRLQPVPGGIVGELYVGGAGVARGYLSRPALTAERFLPDPWSERPGARLYRTGDLARHLPDGNLEFLGRADLQVKIRGFRVELGEIEAILGQHPGVREAVALVREDLSGSRFLVAYIVAADRTEIPTGEELRQYLHDRIPDYMVPSSYIALERLPLTPNGKVDRGALPRLSEGQVRWATAGGPYAAPRTPAEVQLVEIWQELLKLERVGVEDDFFAVGGHSLLATQLMARVRKVFHANLPLRALFAAPTIAKLAAVIAESRAEAAGEEVDLSDLPAIVPDPGRRHDPFPLNPVQQAYWVGRRGELELGNVASHSYAEFESAEMDVGRLTLALRQLIERHEMLRVIVDADGWQRVLPEVPAYTPPTVDLRGVPPAAAADQLAALRQRMSHQVLPAERWPLFDIVAVLLPDAVRVHISLDALIFDAWSGSLLTNEFLLLYSQFVTRFEPLELTFRDYVLAERALDSTELYRRSRRYWWKRLETLPPAPQLPLAIDPAALRQPRFGRRTGYLLRRDWARLRQRAALAGLTPSGIVLAAFAEVIAQWSRNPRFTLDLTLFNRLPLHPQVNSIVGDFTSLTLLEVDSSLAIPFELRARRIQEQLWEDLDYRFISGVEILRELARRRGGMGRALMPVVLTSTLAQPGADRPQEITVAGDFVYSITQTPQVWLDHQVFEVDETLIFNWDAVEELFPAGLLESMFGAYCGLLERLAREEGSWQEVGRKWLPAAELAEREAANATRQEVPAVLLHEPFWQQAERRPQRQAVVWPSGAMSYGEVARRAEELAGRLVGLGAGRERLVGVVMEKGWEQVVAVLGVLRSGAAYLPVDPRWPRERQWHLLERGEVSVVVTQPWLEPALEWPGGVVRVVVSAESAGSELVAPEGEIGRRSGCDDLAYVIYTSGSTGWPKGVMVEHRAAVNTVLAMSREFGVGEGDRVLGLSSLSFDLSVYDIFGTLGAGATLVLPEAGAERDAGAWAELVRGESVTVWNSVPALLEMLLEYAAGGSGVGEGLRSLRLVLLSGDWIGVGLPARLRSWVPGVELVSLGGATEASIWSIAYRIGEVGADWSSIPYGRPLANQQFAVLNGSLEPCPVWVAGELYIGGSGLARGYWRDAEKTSQSFVHHPESGERLYRTGDLGRYLPGGLIEFLGREDTQVKVQGHRIELGEIESALLRCPGVRQAVVVAAGEAGSARRLVAYVVAAGESGLAAAEDGNGGLVLRPGLAGEAVAVRPLPSQVSDKIALLELKLSEPGLRRGDEGCPYVELSASGGQRPAVSAYLWRRSHRRFAASAVEAPALGGLLGALRSLALPQDGLEKYRYASAGHLYPVQTYVYVKSGRVAGVPGGLYYHHPHEHRLVCLAAGAVLDRTAYAEVNRGIFDEAAFALFLVGKLSAIAPFYGERAPEFCRLEAGYMTQLLMEAAPAEELGLCPIGSVDLAGFAALLAQDGSELLLHSLLGGVPATEEAAAEAPTGGDGSSAGPDERPGAAVESGARWHGAPLIDEVDRLHFKLARHGLRRDGAGSQGVELAGPAVDEALIAAYHWRRTDREFLRQPIEGDRLASLLACLAVVDLPGWPLGKRRYPSAGHLYPVQVYLDVMADRFQGLPAGTYYYHPRQQRLIQLAAGARAERRIHAVENQPIFDQAAFSIFLVGFLGAIAPLYRSAAFDLSLLEAGAMSQLLMSVSPGVQIGLCPIGGVDFEDLRADLGLGADHVLLHSLLAGPIVARTAPEAGRPEGLSVPAPGGEAALLEREELAAEVRAFLRDRLPEHMVPPDLLVLDELPLSPNGKVDRAALPVPGEAAARDLTSFVAPRDTLELQLVEIWQRLFDRRPIGVHDDFFELGGDSIAAVRLVAQIRSRFGRELPLRAFFREPTIELVAAVLRRESDAGPSQLSLVEIRFGSEAPPFFCVHPAGGNLVCYHLLADDLGGRAFYGLQAPGIEDREQPLRSVEAMAALYLEAMRKVQPQGPYLLGGWSFGGLPAFEIARRLEAMGQTVALLAILDTEAPVPGNMPAFDEAELLAAFLQEDAALSVDLLRSQGGIDEQLAFVVEQARRHDLLPPDFDVTKARRYFDVYHLSLEAARVYLAEPFAGKLTVFRAEERPAADPGDARLGWGTLARDVEVVAVPGDHHSMVRAPHVKTLAARLRETIARALESQPH
jgi:amino acid adenylation domain-containing protein